MYTNLKITWGMAIAALLLGGVPAAGALICSDSFTTSGTMPARLDQTVTTGTGWATAKWTSNKYVNVVTPATPLVYHWTPGYGVNGGSFAVQSVGYNSSNDLYRKFASQSSDVYVSFLFRWKGGTLDKKDEVRLWLDDGAYNSTKSPTVGSLISGGSDFAASFGTGKNIQRDPVAAVLNTTYFVVAHIYKDGNSKTYNRIALWVYPDGSLSTVPDVVTSLYDSKLKTLSRVGLRTASLDQNDVFQFDELKIGQTWDDVVVFGPAPEPSTMVLLALGGLTILLRKRKT